LNFTAVASQQGHRLQHRHAFGLLRQHVRSGAARFVKHHRALLGRELGFASKVEVLAGQAVGKRRPRSKPVWRQVEQLASQAFALPKPGRSLPPQLQRAQPQQQVDCLWSDRSRSCRRKHHWWRDTRADSRRDLVQHRGGIDPGRLEGPAPQLEPGASIGQLHRDAGALTIESHAALHHKAHLRTPARLLHVQRFALQG
jgi:hypothetical protein